MLKLNTYNQEACFRLVNKNVTVLQHKFLWKGLHLNCKKQSLMFTRNTNQKLAENRIRCNCADFNITSVFYDEIENRLPVRRPWISFEAVRDTEVIAKIPTLVTAELLVTFKRDVTAAIEEVTDPTRTISNTIAQGCHHCTRRAISNVTCTSTNQAARPAIRCDDKHFTIPCSPEGTTLNHVTNQVHSHASPTEAEMHGFVWHQGNKLRDYSNPAMSPHDPGDSEENHRRRKHCPRRNCVSGYSPHN
ncbi:hypothetical protein RB195_008151 [Necator americanus]|uniref:Phlebovirus glycoprotein G2 fusion domain-containing protein n=1 Tax=Necator americanus TaxID=51031 RepID=A0ABR1CM82_NECAM